MEASVIRGSFYETVARFVVLLHVYAAVPEDGQGAVILCSSSVYYRKLEYADLCGHAGDRAVSGKGQSGGEGSAGEGVTAPGGEVVGVGDVFCRAGQCEGRGLGNRRRVTGEQDVLQNQSADSQSVLQANMLDLL